MIPKIVFRVGDIVQLHGFSGIAEGQSVLLESPEACQWANSAISPEELPGYAEFVKAYEEQK